MLNIHSSNVRDEIEGTGRGGASRKCLLISEILGSSLFIEEKETAALLVCF